MVQGATSEKITAPYLVLKKKFLEGILPRFNEFLYADTYDTVKKIWTDFEEIYNLATDPNGDPQKFLFPNPTH